jgi:hypothetical protein
MSIQKYKGIITALSISLVLGITAPQSAIADNLPADTTYSDSINKFYNLEFIPADEKYRALLTEPAGISKRTGAKYKSWLKRVKSSMNKISSALSKVSALPAGPSYSKSDVQLKKYIEAYSTYLVGVKASLSRTKVLKSDQIMDRIYADATAIEGDAWIALYTEDLAASNFSAPTTAPSVTFTASDDANGGKTLTATLADNASFNQQALRITSYDIEWYVGSTTSAAIPNSVELSSSSNTVTLDLTETVVGGLYFFRVKAINSVGAGPWSTFFSATIGA